MYDDILTTSNIEVTTIPPVTSESITTTTQTFYINDAELIKKADSALNFLHVIAYLLCIIIIAYIVNWLWKQFKSLLGTF